MLWEDNFNGERSADVVADAADESSDLVGINDLINACKLFTFDLVLKSCLR